MLFIKLRFHIKHIFPCLSVLKLFLCLLKGDNLLNLSGINTSNCLPYYKHINVLPFSFLGCIIVGLSGMVFSWMVSGIDTALRLSCEFQSSFLWSLASPEIRVMDGLKKNVDCQIHVQRRETRPFIERCIQYLHKNVKYTILNNIGNSLGDVKAHVRYVHNTIRFYKMWTGVKGQNNFIVLH